MTSTFPIWRVVQLVVISGLSVLPFQALAQDRLRDTAPLANEDSFSAQAFGGVVAPYARLAGLFDAGGAPIRTKGVQSIQQIATGVYCIRPSVGTNINVNTIIPSVSVEYFHSLSDEVQVQWAARNSGCGPGRIGVYTFRNLSLSGGNYVFSNGVGFSIVVP